MNAKEHKGRKESGANDGKDTEKVMKTLDRMNYLTDYTQKFK